MKDYLETYCKYLKYDNAIKVENEEKKKKNCKRKNDNKLIKDQNIVRVINEIQKNINSNISYKRDSKDTFFNDPIYQLFPSKSVTVKKTEHISYVCRTTDEEDVTKCLKRIYDIISNMYSENFLIKNISCFDDLLNVFIELCRQVAVISFDRGYVLKELFNYKVMLLNKYEKLFKSSLAFNLKKQVKQAEIINNMKKEIENKKNRIHSLKMEIINTEEMIENETINVEKEISEINIIYQNKIDKLKRNNQRKKEEFIRILQL